VTGPTWWIKTSAIRNRGQDFKKKAFQGKDGLGISWEGRNEEKEYLRKGTAEERNTNAVVNPRD